MFFKHNKYLFLFQCISPKAIKRRRALIRSFILHINAFSVQLFHTFIKKQRKISRQYIIKATIIIWVFLFIQAIESKYPYDF
jgi:hypothetical protein